MGLCGNLDEIDVAFARHPEGLGSLDDADLLAFLVDQSHFGHTDPFIDPRARAERVSVELSVVSSNALPRSMQTNPYRSSRRLALYIQLGRGPVG
ncbi:MAG: hypothetical protein U5Q44_09770 [Dehalococcoidia bacterium]|nr:hypothetical protein [Dehalococcoidia bacterium]